MPFGAPHVTGRAVSRDQIVIAAPKGPRMQGLHRMGPKGPRPAFMAAILVITLLSWVPTMPASGANGSFGGGSGTPSDPYIIEDVWDLQNMSKDLDASYVLANDINATATADWNNGAGFAPIGDHFNEFEGTLDGKGHNITGLFIDRPMTDEVGLFGMGGLDGSGHKLDWIKNISIIHVNMTGLSYVAGLVGFNSGKVRNSYASGAVDGKSCVGGLVGYNAGDVYTSFATANVSGDYYIGGLVGRNIDTVNNSYATGYVTATGYVGGLVGHNEQGTVSNSYAAGHVTGTDKETGGLVESSRKAQCRTVSGIIRRPARPRAPEGRGRPRQR